MKLLGARHGGGNDMTLPVLIAQIHRLLALDHVRTYYVDTHDLKQLHIGTILTVGGQFGGPRLTSPLLPSGRNPECI
jgi:hypothetical protein